MIQPDVEQRLGRKAFFLLLSRKATVAILFIVLSLVLLAVSGSIIKALTLAVSMGGQATISTVAPISSTLSFIISGLFLLGILLLLVSFIASWIQYRNFTFDFGEFDLHLKRGILDRKETSIPYRQIQDVNIERNFDHQLMGLAKVVLTTAGHEETGEKGMSEIILEPIDKDMAQEIRALLERKIGVQVVVDQKVADKEIATETPVSGEAAIQP